MADADLFQLLLRSRSPTVDGAACRTERQNGGKPYPQTQPCQRQCDLDGAPIYFPNYKIPFLLQDVGLHVAAHLDYTMRRAVAGLTIEETADITLSGLGQRFYQADCSGSYAKNGTLQAAASELLDSCDVDGVVYCVLKARHGRKEGRFAGRGYGAWYLHHRRQFAPSGAETGGYVSLAYTSREGART